MKRLNKVAYERLVVQAQEAKELGIDHLAEGVLASIGAIPKEESEKETYSSIELERDVYNGLWKIAVNIMAYHDTVKIDASKVDEVINSLSATVLAQLEKSIDLQGKVGASEPKLPGEK